MKESDIKKLAEEVDLKKIVNDVKQRLIVKDERLSEAFRADAKSYPQVTSAVTQKTKDAHYELYRSHVDAFNRISTELDAASRSLAEPDQGKFNQLKASEAANLNSLWLHEMFFANCFDPNSNIYMDSTAFIKLQSTFGSFDDWQRDFMACACRASNSSWAICGYNTFLRSYVNTVITCDSYDVMLGLIPVIVLDMHEHSRRDYLNDKKSYVTAMMQEFNWNVIDERFERAEAIARIVKQ